VTLRDTLLQVGYVMIAGGAVFATWALLTGPLARYMRKPDEPNASADAKPATPDPEDDPRTGST
jgi:hypothetical protein